MKTKATVSGIREFLEHIERDHGDLPIFWNDDALDEWPLDADKFIVSQEKGEPGDFGYYPLRVTVKIYV